MATQVKRRRGTASENAAFTGAIGEIVFETDTKRVAGHDGTLQGGYPCPNALDVLKKTLQSATTTGTNTYAITLPWFPTAYSSGIEVEITIGTTNTSGTCTLNINSVGAVSLKDEDGNDFGIGDLAAGERRTFRHNGTQFREVPAGGGGVVSVKRQVFTSSGTYTPNSGMLYCIIEAVGGGGGGGANSTASGGGAGETSISVKTATDVGASQTVTIGAGGNAGNGSIPTSPGAGGNTSVGSLVVANGGNAGVNTNGSNSNAGGTGGTGDLKIPGGYGAKSAGSGLGAAGGNSTRGFGGTANGTTNISSVGYGAGGAAMGSTSTANAGTAGIVIITEFCSQV